MNMYRKNDKQRLKINHSLEISDQSSSSSESLRMNQNERNMYYEPGYLLYQNETVQTIKHTANSCSNVVKNHDNLDIHYSNSLPLNLSKHVAPLHTFETFYTSEVNKPKLLDLDEHKLSQSNKKQSKIQSISTYETHIPQSTTINLGQNYCHTSTPSTTSTHNVRCDQFYPTYLHDQYSNYQSAIQVLNNQQYYAAASHYEEGHSVIKNDEIYNTFSKSRLNQKLIQPEKLLENNAIYHNFTQNTLKFVDDDSPTYHENTSDSKFSGIKLDTKDNDTNNSIYSMRDISEIKLNKNNENVIQNSLVVNEEIGNEELYIISENILNKDNEKPLNHSDTLSEDKIILIETTPIKSSDNEELLPSSESKASDKSESFKIEKISPTFLSMENSNNATDNSSKLFGKFSDKNALHSDNAINFNGTLKRLTQDNKCDNKLSFENKIPKLVKNKSKNVMDELNNIPSTSSFCSLKRNESTTYFAPASPSLFSDEDDSIDDSDIPLHLKKSEEIDEDGDRLKKNDLELLKRLQKTLGGVLPPPSVTISQLDVGDMLELYKKNINLYESKSQSLNVTPSKIKAININDENKQSRTPPNLKSWINIKESESSPKSHSKFEVNDKNIAIKTSSSNQTNETENKPFVSNSLLVSCTMNDVLETEWPNIMQCRYHGVHYNRGTVSEEFELLCMKYGERYVGAETQSTFTFGMSTASQRFNLKSRYTQSPGRRLSHLARRRQTFSSANLQAGTTTGTSQTKSATSSRQIMLNIKKPEQRRRFRPITRRTPGRRTPGKLTPGKKVPGRKTPSRRTPGRKTPGKKTPRKATPSTSAKKRSAARRLIIMDDDSSKSCGPSRETSKRALFVSPTQFKLSLPPVPVNNRALKSKRALFGSPNKEMSESSSDASNDYLRKRKRALSPCLDGYEAKRSHLSLEALGAGVATNKRKRISDADDMDDLCIQKNKVPRSLSFSHYSNSAATGQSKTLSRRASENVLSAPRGDLSETHKKKLLWAVAEALRSQNVGMSHPLFKSHAATLARLTRKLMPDLGKPNIGKQIGSTSDRMLRLARQHAFSVIKGKKVDEILIEEQIRQSRAASSKVSGYVPLSEYEQSKISALSQRISKPPLGCHKTKPTTTTFAHPGENSMNLFSSNSNSMFSENDNSNNANEKTKTVLQDKTINVESSSSSRKLDNKNLVGKTKARRQISFDDFSGPTR